MNASLINNSQGVIIGSALIGQPFASEKYFWNRPSTTNYSTANPKNDEAGILKTGVSGAGNLAASNPALLELINWIGGEIKRLKKADIQPTGDLV